jgi:hypothetical protein
MKRIWFLGIFFAAFLSAQDAPKVDPALQTEVVKLLKAVHLDDLMRQQLQSSLPTIVKIMKQNPSVSPQLADEFAKEFEAEILASHEITDLIVDAYASRFSLSEIKDLEAFYNSPTGRKLVEAQPQLLGEVSQKAKAYGQSLAMQLFGKIAKEHPEYMNKETAPPPPAK